MTGYGRTEGGKTESCFTIEVRSLNNRYLDIQIKTSRELAPFEARMKKIVQDRCLRGRFEIYISRINKNEKTGKLSIDDRLAGQYVNILKDLKLRFGLGGEVDFWIDCRFS